MSAVDETSQSVFVAASAGEHADQVHVATYAATAAQLAARGFDLELDIPTARVLRSVVMKPESEAQIPSIHARLERLAQISAGVIC
jgi:hypothetical protein